MSPIKGYLNIGRTFKQR